MNLIIIIRNLYRNKLFSLINLFGLVIGIVVASFIFLWVHNERSYDSFHHDAGQIYRITNTLNPNTENSYISELSPYPLDMAVKNIPEVQETALLYNTMDEEVTINNEIFHVLPKLYYVSSDWFKMFDYNLVDGSLDAFANHPFSMVITSSEAKKYFGNERAVGKTVTLKGNNHTIQAVVQDNPANSIFQFSMMAPIEATFSESYRKKDSERWGMFLYITFVKLREGVNKQSVCQKINEIFQTVESDTEANLVTLTDIHFETDFNSRHFPQVSSRIVTVFWWLGMLILFTASINYVNLTTAQSNTKTKNVGVKKIFGAGRQLLFFEFITESFIIILLSIVISFPVIWIFSPLFFKLIGGTIVLFSSPVIWIIQGMMLLAVTLMSGIYPALVLSAFHPERILSGSTFQNIKSYSLRKGLVIFQFTLSSILIMTVITIHQQMSYMTRNDLGYNREQVVSFETPAQPWIENTMQAIRNEVATSPNISVAALCDQEIVKISGLNTIENNVDWEGHIETIPGYLQMLSADCFFKDVHDLKMIEGRWFDEGQADITNVILNETAISKLKITEPAIGKRFTIFGKDGTIVGVVKDFHYDNMHKEIGALVIRNNQNRKLIIKIEAGKTAQALTDVKRVWNSFFPNAPCEYAFLDDSLNKMYQSEKRTSQLFLCFCVFTVFVALMGLFGLSTFSVERRYKEIGIRRIMGASLFAIVRMLIREYLFLIIIAFVVAAPVSWWLMDKWLNDFVYHISISWWIFALAGSIVISLALLTVSWKALKAAMANPIKAIKTV